MALQISSHVLRCVEVQLKQAHHALHLLGGHILALVQGIQNCAGLGIQPGVPDPVVIVDVGHGLDAHTDPQKMGNPTAQHLTQGFQRRFTPVHADHPVKRLAARPIGIGIVSTQHIKIDRAQVHATLLQQLSQGTKAARGRKALHRVPVSGHDRAILLDRYRLNPKQHFGHAHLQSRCGAAQDVAQQDLSELLHQQGRDIDALALKQGQIAGL